MSEGARNIVAAMKAHGVDKVVACTSGGWWGHRGGAEGWGWVLNRQPTGLYKVVLEPSQVNVHLLSTNCVPEPRWEMLGTQW